MIEDIYTTTVPQNRTSRSTAIVRKPLVLARQSVKIQQKPLIIEEEEMPKQLTPVKEPPPPEKSVIKNLLTEFI